MEDRNFSAQNEQAPAGCRRVSELADLVEIFHPEVQVCSWQRELDPVLERYIGELQGIGELQTTEVLSFATPPKLNLLPEGTGRQALLEDLALLREIVSELLGCEAVGLRLARIGRALCPGWHLDRLSIRLVCTYRGPGTQWLDDQSVERCDMSVGSVPNAAFSEAEAGEIVLLKGALWQGNEDYGAIHRSPDLSPNNTPRTLVTLDPLWAA